MKALLAVCSILAATLATRAAWQHFPAGKAFALGFAADASEQRMFLGLARGGLWRSEDAGTNWEPINWRLQPNTYFVPYNAHVVDPSGDTVIVEADGQAVDTYDWYTANGGDSWARLPDYLVPDGLGDFMQAWHRDRNVWMHLTSEEIQISTNGGQEWYWAYPIDRRWVGNLHGLFQDAINDSTLYCTGPFARFQDQTVHGGLQRSDNLGRTWRPIIDFYTLFDEEQADVQGMVRLSNGDLVALGTGTTTYYWENGTVLISTDDGATWTRNFGGLPDRFQPSEIIEDQNQAGTVYVAGDQKYGLYWSHDYGRTWERCYNGLPGNVCYVNHLYQNPYSGIIYASLTGWGVYRTADHGASWQPVPMPPVGPLGYWGVTDESVFVRDDGYRQWRLDDGSSEWQEVSYPLAQDTLVLMRPICYHSGDTLVSALWKRNVTGPATDVLQMIYSYDGGATWEIEPYLPFLSERYFTFSRQPTGAKLMTSIGSRLYVSDDLGHTWDSTETPNSAYIFNTAANDSAVYILALSGGTAIDVFRTTDNGHNWRDLNLSSPYQVGAGPLFAVQGEEVFVTTQGHCFYWAGQDWEPRGEIPNIERLDFLVGVERTPFTLFGLSYRDNQAWVSEDMGWTWHQPVIEHPYSSQSFSFTDLRYNAVQHRIWAIAGVGTCYLDEDELSAVRPLQFKPADYTVLSVYPNPFNDQARIRFDVLKSERVGIKLYDLQGRLVCTLSDEIRDAGRHELAFDATGLASGTYFVRLKSASVTRTQKILLLH